MPSNGCHDKESAPTTDGCISKETLPSPLEDAATTGTLQSNGRLPDDTINVFIKHKESLQESA